LSFIVVCHSAAKEKIMRFTQSNSRRRFATLASALAFGAVVSFADFSVLPSVSAAENSTQSAQTAEKPGYAIIASPQVLDDADWAKVVESLKTKRSEEFNVVVIRRETDDAAFAELAKVFPRYACFVAKPEEATKANLATIWQKTRALDDDPYGDVIWGIITGYDADDALRMTQTEDRPTTKVAAGTSIALQYFNEGIAYDELKKNLKRVKKPGAAPEITMDAPDDTTRALAESLDGAQLFVASGHATQRNWMIGFAYRNGYFVSENGKLFGKPSTGEDPFEINASGSKIYLASGNCLIGDIDGKDAMALALIHSANVDQMVGYVVPTWFGYMGWGVQDYYIEQPGRFTLAEAFFANNQALLSLLEEAEAENATPSKLPKGAPLSARYVQGLEYDRDVVALYGDPAWRNALAEQESGWAQTLKSEKTEDGRTLWTFTVEPKKGDKSFELIDPNGSERGARPFFQFFPTRVADPQIVSGAEFNPVVVDNFVLVPQTEKTTPDKPIVIQVSTR
jgi:zinc protease